MEFTGKNKNGNTMQAKLRSVIGQKWLDSFDVENFFVSIRQAGSRQASAQPVVFLSQHF